MSENDTEPPKRSNGKFIKGVSGNPDGQAKASREVIVLARRACPAAVITLGQIMMDKDAPPQARVMACREILDRAGLVVHW